VEYSELIDRLAGEAAALRVAAVAAGPQTKVPSCPDWTVDRLVSHVARVYSWTTAALRTDPRDDPPGPQPRPELTGFDDTLGWWDTAIEHLIEMLRGRDCDAPAWTINADRNAWFWARRMAHETAIHRLDAELAAGTAAPLLFDPVFAADGIDEFARTMMLGAQSPYEGELSGTVLVHAADAGRAWLIAIAPGERFTTVEQPVLDADASVVGTADAVYRALWGRPSGAVISGDKDLLDLLGAP
jgi:uncharacterized protein (TIGR03083 family)